MKNVGKIMNNFQCYIAVNSSSDEAKEVEVGDKIDIRFIDGLVKASIVEKENYGRK